MYPTPIATLCDPPPAAAAPLQAVSAACLRLSRRRRDIAGRGGRGGRRAGHSGYWKRPSAAGSGNRKLYVRQRYEDTRQLLHHYALSPTPEEIGEVDEGVDIYILLRLPEDGLL